MIEVVVVDFGVVGLVTFFVVVVVVAGVVVVIVNVPKRRKSVSINQLILSNLSLASNSTYLWALSRRGAVTRESRADKRWSEAVT